MKNRTFANWIGRSLLILSLVLPLVGCGISSGETVSPAGVEEVSSNQERVSAADVPGEDLDVLTDGNLAFALDLYHQVESQKENLFYSPYSISVALAMTYAGARGETAEQMAETLHSDLPPDKLHPVFNSLDQILASRGEEEPLEDGGDPFQLNIANALWGQKDYHFEQDFLDTIAENYGAGMHLVNFMDKAEEARKTINHSGSMRKRKARLRNSSPRVGWIP